jgi:hypothetical protein
MSEGTDIHPESGGGGRVGHADIDARAQLRAKVRVGLGDDAVAAEGLVVFGQRRAAKGTLRVGVKAPLATG